MASKAEIFRQFPKARLEMGLTHEVTFDASTGGYGATVTFFNLKSEDMAQQMAGHMLLAIRQMLAKAGVSPERVEFVSGDEDEDDDS